MANNLAYYIRLSLADDDVGDSNKDESNSVKNQRDLILSYIDSHPEFKGWTVHEFIDDGFTGTNDDRPNFQRLIDLTWQGQIQCIIVKDHSRFARNYIITGNYLEQVFPLLGVRFIAINDNYDSARNQSGAQVSPQHLLQQGSIQEDHRLFRPADAAGNLQSRRPFWLCPKERSHCF